jgi:hypothetical protein
MRERLLNPFLAATEILLRDPHFSLLVGRGRVVVDSVAADATRSSAAMDTILLLRAVGILPPR